MVAKRSVPTTIPIQILVFLKCRARLIDSVEIGETYR